MRSQIYGSALESGSYARTSQLRNEPTRFWVRAIAAESLIELTGRRDSCPAFQHPR